MISHPSASVDKYLLQTLREEAPAGEKLHQLTRKQLDVIYKQKWFNLFVPKKFGGLALSLPEVLRLEEGLAWADGSSAWVVTLCSGAAWFVGFMDQDLAEEIFSNDHACIAGSGMATGRAIRKGDGYDISGQWKYASGSMHATIFTCNCTVWEKSKPVLLKNSSSEIRAFVLKRKEVKIHPNWNGMGMMATGSHGFEIAKQHVPAARSFAIDSKHAVLQDPAFRYPFLQLADTTLTVNLSGMANRFLDLCDPIFEDKYGMKISFRGKFPDLDRMLEKAHETLNESRALFFDTALSSWQALVRGHVPHSLWDKVSHVSHDLARVSRQVVQDLFPYCGLRATDTKLEINRVWRNINTASQHTLFNF